MRALELFMCAACLFFLSIQRATARTTSHCSRQQCTVFQFVTLLTEDDDGYETSDHEAEHAEDYDQTPRFSVDEGKGGKSCSVM